MNPTPRPKTCDKKIKVAEIKLQKILNKIESLKLNNFHISKLDISRKRVESGSWRKRFGAWIPVALLFFFANSVWWIYYGYFTDQNCPLALPPVFKSLFRPPEDCSMCAEVGGVVRAANLTAEEFEEQFAYSATPVIVTDATVGWKAIDEFDFNFFAAFYSNTKLGHRTNDCFFFPYKSGLRSLQEVFTMDPGRANLSGAPWYVGWSTCYDGETRRLRGYYSRPYFLPKTAESDMVDWIFMGGPGQGAHMHVDSVKHTSWQAQVRGRKRWQLAPPPECLYCCRWLTFTVHPGEICRTSLCHFIGGGHEPVVPPHQRAAGGHQHHHRRGVRLAPTRVWSSTANLTEN